MVRLKWEKRKFFAIGDENAAVRLFRQAVQFPQVESDVLLHQLGDHLLPSAGTCSLR